MIDQAADTGFKLANYLIMLFWALLIVAPQRTITTRLVHAPWIFLAIAASYLLFALNSFIAGPMPEGGGFGTLGEVMVLFGSKPAVMAGWLHYLAFDLFVGAWQVRDARRCEIPHLYIVPCLILTLMLGPLGLAVYLLMRALMTRRLSLVE